jgi:hypothetical protein
MSRRSEIRDATRDCGVDLAYVGDLLESACLVRFSLQRCEITLRRWLQISRLTSGIIQKAAWWRFASRWFDLPTNDESAGQTVILSPIDGVRTCFWYLHPMQMRNKA